MCASGAGQSWQVTAVSPSETSTRGTHRLGKHRLGCTGWSIAPVVCVVQLLASRYLHALPCAMYSLALCGTVHGLVRTAQPQQQAEVAHTHTGLVAGAGWRCCGLAYMPLWRRPVQATQPSCASPLGRDRHSTIRCTAGSCLQPYAIRLSHTMWWQMLMGCCWWYPTHAGSGANTQAAWLALVHL